MSLKPIIIGTCLAAAAIAAIIHFVSQKRYLTANPNKLTEDFKVFSEDEECSICLTTMNINSPSCALLDCGHFMHQACLRKFVSHENSRDLKCPVCRKRFQYK